MSYIAFGGLSGFCLGIVVGFFLALKALENVNLTIKQKVFEVDKPDGETQFFEAVSDKERFDKASNVTDIING